ncbi:MAG TPA: hypothetical protein PKA41_18460 [Verrucomicrobiota bacterium]|nr:hypothetical protein [Verrucomicrobiota bacterium]
MSDVQWLFLVLALLYAWECACWLRPGSVAFTTWFGRRWRIRHPGTLAGNDKGGFIPVAPLPPLGTLLTTAQLPFSCSPDALLGFVSTNVNPGPRSSQTSQLFRFDDINEVRAKGKNVLINGRRFLRAGSQWRASQLVSQIKRLRELKRDQRESAITALHLECFDTKALEQRWAGLRQTARPLRLLANAIVALVFVVAPVLIWTLGFALSWIGLLATLLVLDVTTAIFFYIAHKKLFPRADDERFTHTLTVLLSPASAMRAHDALTRQALEMFHPLAAATLFLPKPAVERFARRVLLDIRHPALPQCPSNDATTLEAERHTRAALQMAVEELLKQHSFDVEKLCRPPSPTDESCCAYCPRCGEQFTTVTARCSDCGGLPVVAFDRQ